MILNKKILYLINIISITILFLYFTSSEFHFYQVEQFSNEELKIYCINLKEHPERWEKIKEKLPRCVRFDAINGKKLNRKILTKKGILKERNTLLDGQLGCALSHISVMDIIKKQPEPYALILEDDVIIPDNFVEELEELKKYFPEKWDVIFLGGCNIFGKKINDKIIKPTDISGTRNLCMHAFIVNKSSIDKLINYLYPLYRPVDSQLRDNFKDLDIFYANPNIINQNKTLTSIRRVLDGLPQSEYWKTHHKDITIDDQ